jgi:hypothetical protein
MGFLKPKDNSKQIVAQQRADEEGRKDLIRQGNERISSIFDGTFTPEFYDKAVSDVTGYYKPILDDQYKEYNRSTVLDLAQRGRSSSSYAGRRFGVLQKTYGRGLDKIRNDAFDFQKGLKGDVAGAESELRGLVQAGADPSTVSDLAINRTKYLAQGPTLNPLVDFFTQYAGNIMNQRIAKNAGFEQRTIPSSKSLIFNPGSSGSVRNVGR